MVNMNIISDSREIFYFIIKSIKKKYIVKKNLTWFRKVIKSNLKF